MKISDAVVVHEVKIVNLLEENPVNEIKAKCEITEFNTIELRVEPYVIVTLKISIAVKMDT